MILAGFCDQTIFSGRCARKGVAVSTLGSWSKERKGIHVFVRENIETRKGS